MIGVYVILNLVSGRRYIGSSVNVPQRWREHLSKLGRGVHPNAALQADWTEHGVKAFSWSLLEESPSRDAAIQAEQTHIDATPDLYNAARRAGSGPRDGFRHTEATKQKISAITRGRAKPEGFGATVSAWKRGRPNPAQSAALKGRALSPEHCEAIRIANTGKKHTEEHKAYMRDLMTGRDTSAWAWKMAATKRGQPWSEKRRAMFEAAKHSGVESKG